MTDLTSLVALVESNDVDGCVAWFSGMPESQRRALAPQCRAIVREVRRDALTMVGDRIHVKPGADCAPVLVYSTASLAEIRTVPLHQLPWGELAWTLLMDRRPPWLEGFVDHLLSGETTPIVWPLVRRLVQEGFVPPPTQPQYPLAMVGGLLGVHPRPEPTTVLTCLRANPDLLEHDIWRLFELEGDGETSLANVDRWHGAQWSTAFLALSADGTIDRQRLLDACLDALQRDFNHYRARWYSALFDKLEPDESELQARADRFVGILRVSAPPVVSWAFTKVQARCRKGAYVPKALIVALEPVVSARAKGVVKKALKLLDRLAKDPEAKALAPGLAVFALGHEAADIQALAMDRVEAWASPDDPNLVRDLLARREVLADTVRTRLDQWLPTTQTPSTGVDATDASQLQTAASALPASLRDLYAIDDLLAAADQPMPALPAARFDGTELSRLRGVTPLEAVASLDALIDLLVRGCEDQLGADDYERALDGLARLGTQRPADFAERVSALDKRTRSAERLPFVDNGPQADLLGLVAVWLAADRPALVDVSGWRQDRWVIRLFGNEYSRTVHSLTDGFLGRRMLGVAQQVGAGISRPLLATPTHSGGLLDPAVLVDRALARLDEPPATAEAVLAMLRLAPDRRAEALARLPEQGAEWLMALRHALGAEWPGTPPPAPDTPALWLAAARARAPWHDDPTLFEVFPDAGPDGCRAARYGTLTGSNHEYSVGADPAVSRSDVQLDCLPQLIHVERTGRQSGTLGTGNTPSAKRLLASCWPMARDSRFAASTLLIAHNLDWWTAAWDNKTVLEPLLDPGTPLRAMGLELLVVALGAKEPGEHLLAVDAAIAAIQDGRLGGDNLGRCLGGLLLQPFVKLGRFATQLTSIADASDAHAAVVLRALDHAMPTVVAAAPRSYQALLVLLEQLCARLDTTVSTDTLAALATLRGSSKAAQAARRITKHRPNTGQSLQAAVEQLAQMRITAAHRWVDEPEQQ